MLLFYLLKIRTTYLEWHETVWNVKERPKQRMAPAKKKENTSFSLKKFYSNHCWHGIFMNLINLELDVRFRSGEEPQGEEEKRQTANQMCPNVARFGVQRQYGLETNSKAGQWWPMASVQKLIVLQPIGQRVEILHRPSGFPSL